MITEFPSSIHHFSHLSRITLLPFSEDAIFHGYLGTLAYSLWRKEASPRRGAEGQHAATGYLTLASNHLEKSLSLDPSHEIFVFCYTEMLEALGEVKKAVRFLQEFCEANPASLAGHRALFHLLHTHSRANQASWITAAVRCLELDPLASFEAVVAPLVQVLTAATPPEDEEALQPSSAERTAWSRTLCGLLASRLDHGPPQQQEGVRIWDAFAALLGWLQQEDPAAAANLCSTREDWWGRWYFGVPSTESYTREAYRPRIAVALLMGGFPPLLRYVGDHDRDFALDPSLPSYGLNSETVAQRLMPSRAGDRRKERGEERR